MILEVLNLAHAITWDSVVRACPYWRARTMGQMGKSYLSGLKQLVEE